MADYLNIVKVTSELPNYSLSHRAWNFYSKKVISEAKQTNYVGAVMPHSAVSRWDRTNKLERTESATNLFGQLKLYKKNDW